MKTIISKIPSREAFFKGTDTLKVGYPWLAFGAIIALESIVNKKQKVLEFGSGGSTVFWAKNCKNVKSFETDEKWFKDVQKKLKRQKNIELLLRNQKQILRSLQSEPENHYDIVLIDIYPKHADRLTLANAAIPKIKPGGLLIIDNYEKFGMENFTYPKNWEIYTFDEFRYSGRGTRICIKHN